MNLVRFIFFLISSVVLTACLKGNPIFLSANEDDDYGIGGTGIIASGDGIGGTGIIGEITGFGSIFVNGVEVEVDTKTLLSVNGQSVPQHDFNVGEIVEILTSNNQAHTSAQHINIKHEVIGPVTSIDSGRLELTILNQTVTITKSMLSSINVGKSIAVSGYRDISGIIQATHVSKAPSNTFLLAGRVSKQQQHYSLYQNKLVSPDQSLPLDTPLILSGKIVQGILNVTRSHESRLLPFTKVSKWIIRGYPELYRSKWKSNDRSNNALAQQKTAIFKVENPDHEDAELIYLSPDSLPRGSAYRGYNHRPTNQNGSATPRGRMSPGFRGNR